MPLIKNMMKTIRSLSFILLLIGQLPAFAGPKPGSSAERGRMSLQSFVSRPKLVVVLVIDQFRADYFTRFQSRFLPAEGANHKLGGFNLLMQRGAYFPFAEYDNLQNMTCPGHSTILTGAFAYSHGIPLNDWMDRETGQTRYCVEDHSSALVGIESQPKEGVSPRALGTTTVGDELKNSGNPGRVIAVSLKDRAAVMLGGHRADLAMWFDPDKHVWISSRYYLPKGQVPDWIDALNRKIASRKGQVVKWESKSATGLSQSSGKEPFSKTYVLGTPESLETPAGGELTTEAAIEAIRHYKLGGGAGTDVLAVSYSSHDFLGHHFGPNSRELEEMTVAEDAIFAHLLDTIGREIPGGMKNVVVAFTADHGMAPTVDYSLAAGLEAGFVNEKEFVKRANDLLRTKFGAVDGEWIIAHREFNYYLNRVAAAQKKVALKDLEDELRAILLKEPYARDAFTATDIREGRFPRGFERQARATYVHGKSGDVVLIAKPFYMVGSKGSDTHMTAYSYDRSVPLVLMGGRIQPGVYASSARVVDLAPTLSFLLGVLPPAQSEGRVLSEALAD